MFKFQEVWFPDGEKHFPEWMKKNGEIVDGRGTYQIRKLREAMRWAHPSKALHCTAIDVGGHVGLWSMQLAARYSNVFAYEPVRAFRECFQRNVLPDHWEPRALAEGWGRASGTAMVELLPYALGNRRGFCTMQVNPADTGGTHVKDVRDEASAERVEMRTLDDEFLHQEDAVDFLKIDCEGYELEVLKGAEKLLRAAKPCVIVEQKPHKLGPNFGIQGTPAVDYLLNLGAKLRARLAGDYVMSWDK